MNALPEGGPVIVYEPLFSKAAIGRTTDALIEHLKLESAAELGTRKVLSELLVSVFSQAIIRPVVLEVVRFEDGAAISVSWGTKDGDQNWAKAVRLNYDSVLRVDPKKMWMDWVIWIDVPKNTPTFEIHEVGFDATLTQMQRYVELAVGTVGSRPESVWPQQPGPGKLIVVESSPPSWSWVKRSAEEIQALEGKLSEFKRVNQELVKQMREKTSGFIPRDPDWEEIKQRLKTAMEMLTKMRRYADELAQENTDLKSKPKRSA